jgi:phage terminase small subunit
MAGVKGRSGGPRKNSGGARPNSGPKPKKSKPAGSANATVPVLPPPATETDMLKHLQNIALGYIDASTIQVRAAIAAVQYTHVKKGDGGKKDEKQRAAEAVASKFNAAPPPLKLVKK